jgi:hypothetical protein
MSTDIKLESFGESFTHHLKETNSPWLDTETAAAYLSCTSGTLRTWRSLGTGPRYRVMHGKLVRYHIDDLNAFVRGEDNR